MGWVLSLAFLFLGLFSNGSDLLQIGLLITSGLFAISGSIGVLATKFKPRGVEENDKEF